jgi:peptidyl-tRNA hydrolase
MNPRLYIAVRADLSPGLQAAQAVHAAIEYAAQNHHSATHWRATSNNVVIVSVPDEWALTKLGMRAGQAGIRSYPVWEPDIGNTLTAVAFEPADNPRKLVADLPLALREVAMA